MFARVKKYAELQSHLIGLFFMLIFIKFRLLNLFLNWMPDSSQQCIAINNHNNKGGLLQPLFFSDGYFSMKKGVLIKIIMIFTVFLGDLEGVGTIIPHTQSTSRSPLLGLIGTTQNFNCSYIHLVLFTLGKPSEKNWIFYDIVSKGG